MCIDRRGFMQVAAGAAGASSLAARHARAEDTSLPDAVKKLKPMLDGVEPISDEQRRARIEKAQRLVAEHGLSKIYVESGSSLFYYTGLRWRRSERMFAMIIPRNGDLAFGYPAFEEERARELIRFGEDIRTWQEHESPYRLVAQILADRGIRPGSSASKSASDSFSPTVSTGCTRASSR